MIACFTACCLIFIASKIYNFYWKMATPEKRRIKKSKRFRNEINYAYNEFLKIIDLGFLEKYNIESFMFKLENYKLKIVCKSIFPDEHFLKKEIGFHFKDELFQNWKIENGYREEGDFIIVFDEFEKIDFTSLPKSNILLGKVYDVSTSDIAPGIESKKNILGITDNIKQLLISEKILEESNKSYRKEFVPTLESEFESECMWNDLEFKFLISINEDFYLTHEESILKKIKALKGIKNIGIARYSPKKFKPKVYIGCIFEINQDISSNVNVYKYLPVWECKGFPTYEKIKIIAKTKKEDNKKEVIEENKLTYEKDFSKDNLINFKMYELIEIINSIRTNREILEHLFKNLMDELTLIEKENMGNDAYELFKSHLEISEKIILQAENDYLDTENYVNLLDEINESCEAIKSINS